MRENLNPILIAVNELELDFISIHRERNLDGRLVTNVRLSNNYGVSAIHEGPHLREIAAIVWPADETDPHRFEFCDPADLDHQQTVAFPAYDDLREMLNVLALLPATI